MGEFLPARHARFRRKSKFLLSGLLIKPSGVYDFDGLDFGLPLNTPDTLKVLSSVPNSRRLTRREILQNLAGGLGASIALPGVLSGHPVQKHLLNALTLDETKTASPDWAPQFLSAGQNESFTLLAEQILPGSMKTQVNRIVDLLLTIDTSANQKAFLASLSEFESEAQKDYGKPLVSLSEIQHKELLTSASAVSGSDKYESTQMPANFRDSFENLKGWIVGTYYSTEQGMRELGWTEDVYFEAPAECEHEDEHH